MAEGKEMNINWFIKVKNLAQHWIHWLWEIYSGMKLLFIESHQNHRYKEVEHYECHKDNAGSDEESTQNWIVIQNL